MNILVTGANGFIGQSLCNRMPVDGWQVRGTIRSIEQAASLPAGVEVVQIESINADTDWSDALAGVDTVVHLAARVHVMNDIVADPLSAFRQVNVVGTERLSRMAAANGVKRFVYISSVKVNGENTGLRTEGLGQKGENKRLSFSEMDVPTPQDPYSISKWEAEQILHKVAEETGLELVILRPPLVYGYGVKANFLRLFKIVDRGIPLPLASIENLRSFIYIGNLVDAIIKCIEHPAAANQTFLVSDGQDISTPELITIIARAMGRKARLFPCPVSLLKMIGRVAGKSAEVERLTGSLRIDNSKIRMTLNWTPPYTIEEGIMETAKAINL